MSCEIQPARHNHWPTQCNAYFGPNLAQNWHFWSIWARPCRLIQCPVMGRLVVVARGLYLAGHLFTLCIVFFGRNGFLLRGGGGGILKTKNHPVQRTTPSLFETLTKICRVGCFPSKEQTTHRLSQGGRRWGTRPILTIQLAAMASSRNYNNIEMIVWMLREALKKMFFFRNNS